MTENGERPAIDQPADRERRMVLEQLVLGGGIGALIGNFGVDLIAGQAAAPDVPGIAMTKGVRRIVTGHNAQGRSYIIQDDRVPLTKAAKVARQSLEELQSLGVIVSQPSQQVLAGLDALRDLLSDAKSGDLAFHGENVLARPTEAWLAEHLPDDLRQFVEQLTAIGG